jgi:hypothetical protein
MVLDALREAFARMVDTPVLWITGLFMGTLFALDLLLQVGGNTVLGARIGFLGLCALPFFLGGSYGAIRGENPGIRGYLRSGARYYFRILLAGAIIVAAAFLTVFLVMIPFTILGGSVQATMTLSLLGVGIPFTFFTFFFDTAVVFEERKVLDSIRRSVEFALTNPVKTAVIYVVNLIIGILILSLYLSDRLQPLMETNQTALQTMTPDQVLNLMAPPVFGIGSVIACFTILIGGTLLLSFKACLFKRHAITSDSAAPPQGEFDEKGRWYRY